jgi:hypothetical protein
MCMCASAVSYYPGRQEFQSMVFWIIKSMVCTECGHSFILQCMAFQGAAG